MGDISSPIQVGVVPSMLSGFQCAQNFNIKSNRGMKFIFPDPETLVPVSKAVRPQIDAEPPVKPIEWPQEVMQQCAHETLLSDMFRTVITLPPEVLLMQGKGVKLLFRTCFTSFR